MEFSRTPRDGRGAAGGALSEASPQTSWKLQLKRDLRAMSYEEQTAALSPHSGPFGGAVQMKSARSATDPLEVQADRAADAVVAGRSAEPLLNGTAAAPGAVQLKAEEGTGAARDKETPPPAVTGYIGINEGAEKELAVLKRALRRVKGHKVISVIDDPDMEGKSGLNWLQQFKKAGVNIYDKGMETWLVFLGIGIPATDPRFVPMIDWLTAAGEIKDQLAGILKLFYEADIGNYKLERLVFSGHSGGNEIWGDQNSSGDLHIYNDIEKVARMFPKAATGVEDIMFSACFSFSMDKVELFVKLFPNLQSVWAYIGFSPSAKKGGSLIHIRNWEKQTRGHDPDKVKRKGHNVAVWTRDAGTKPDEPGGKIQLPNVLTPKEVLSRAEAFVAEDLPQYMDGRMEPEDDDDLRDFYTYCQILLIHPEAPRADKPKWKAMAQTALRLRKWKYIVGHFATERKSLIQEVYHSEPDKYLEFIGKLKRAWIKKPLISMLKETIDQVKSGKADKPPADIPAWTKKAMAILEEYENGLYKLDPAHIPESWCG